MADEERPENRGVQAHVSILLDPINNRKYFFKAYKSIHVFRQERIILHRVGREGATPKAMCYMDAPERGIVMELASGGDLYSESWYRPDNPLRFESYHQFIQAVAHLVASLASVHSTGYLHNDLRPGNVIFTHPRRLQVIDFGLSRKLGKKGVHSKCCRNSPPETAFLQSLRERRQRINSTASDWYTLGVLTHFFVAKGIFCIQPENYYGREECNPGQNDIFWPYKSMTLNNKTNQVIYEWTDPLPVIFPDALKDFLKKLIVADPLSRDFRGQKLFELLNHKLFEAIDWNEINPNLLKSKSKKE